MVLDILCPQFQNPNYNYETHEKKKNGILRYPATFQLASQTNQNSPLVLGEPAFQKPLTYNTGTKCVSVSKEEGE